MTDNRWRRIEELFHEAAGVAPNQRAEFLSQVCAGDEELRRQVESLLANDKSKDEVLEAAVAEAVDQLPAESSEFRLSTGTQLGPYEILKPLGAGGMGEIYSARDRRLGRTVALKILATHMMDQPGIRSRLQSEARAISSLNHPNICTLHDIGRENGIDYLVMEYVEGQTLAERLKKGQLPFPDVLQIAIEISEALDYAHSHGVIHRDLKPGNIMLTDRGSKLVDFGLAKLSAGPRVTEKMEVSSVPTATIAALLTTPGTALGTVAYMSPEQARGEELDARTDLWSFGAVLYEMATGRVAFPGNSLAMVHDAILNRQPTPLSRLRPELPSDLERVINKALEKDRKLRYQGAAEMRTDLQRLKRDSESGRTVAASTGNPSLPFPRWAVITGATVVVVGLAIGGWLFYPRKAQALSETDTIVLADFANYTGDAVFDGTLKQALATEIQQSPFLNILTDLKVSETLKLMGRSADQRLDAKSALDLCRRAGSKAVLDGSIASLGSEYVIGLNAVNCQTGESLAREEVQATKKEEVLRALDKAATKLREKLGESLRTVQKFDTPLEQATTPSLEALKAYSLGWKNRGPDTWRAALPAYQRAVQLDPKFAMAYAALGQLYTNIGKKDLALENLQKAYDLRDRVSERERFYIESHYYHHSTGDLEKARQVYELWQQSYPRDSLPPFTLRWIYADLGQHDRALPEARENLRLDPTVDSYVYLVISYLSLNRLGEARATAEEALAKKLDSPGMHVWLYELAFLQNDAPGMEQQVTWFSGKSAGEATVLFEEAATAAYFGRLSKAREFNRRAVALNAGPKWAAIFENITESLFGNMAKARQAIAASKLSTPTDPYTQYLAAIALAFAEDTVRAQALGDDLAKRFPEDTLVQFIYLPTIRAQLALDRKDPFKAVESLQAARPYELGLTASLFPVYVRGKAYLAAHQGSEAATEFQKILDHPGVVSNEITGALAHLGLARAYALAGDAAKAHAAYQDFLTLWKDADPDIPILEQAKAEYAKLK